MFSRTVGVLAATGLATAAGAMAAEGAAAPALTVTQRISVATDGTQSNGSSGAPAVGAGGNMVAFDSAGRDLVRGDTNRSTDVFVRHRRSE